MGSVKHWSAWVPILLPLLLITPRAVHSADNLAALSASTMQQILASSTPADWRVLNPQDTLYMELPQGRVVIELNPAYAPLHVANIRTLAREHYWDGLAILRVQDDYVTQWGDPAAEAEHPRHPPRSLGKAKATVSAEFERNIAPGLPFTRLPDGDVYAPEVGFSDGFPAARDPRTGKTWLAQCYGMVAVARDTAPDSGSGAELYAVIGQAPRQLDRNAAVVGRVVQGMQYLSALPRGNGPLGFYVNPAHQTRILRVRLAADLLPRERLPLEVMRTGTKAFAAVIESRRNRSNPWFHHKAGKIDVCNVPLPVRLVPANGK